MPTYEYACEQCGIFEVFQSMSEDALKKCPTCDSKKVQRLISGGAGVIFKGDGFWETDYNRSADYQSKSQSEQPAKKTDGAPEAPQPKGAAQPNPKAGQEKQRKKDPKPKS